ncbi:YolD-like family protein [Paenibacillus endoradicis]|uniref:YolD-like family protein n=1 Tax=Paenibacillus endoradicis TaxID=2972487 RepID=UPI002158CB8E|nr:YolD-like family protein [Paenibacillus endoradicis]MCR8656904.1 YolD-like family protein [Paenibacillus endoradicis]
MSTKLEGNGLWESSRMMLPEHKGSIIQKDQEQKRRERIELDEQELNYINDTLIQSLRHSKPVSIKMYHSFEELVIIGVVERLDRQIGRFKVDGEWFILGDIERVTID